MGHGLGRVALACALLLAAGCRATDGEPADASASARPPALVPVSGTAGADPRQALAERLAPMVWLARGEEYGPADASRFVRDSVLRFDHGRDCKDDRPVATEVDPGRLGRGGYTHEAAARPHPQSEDPLSCNHEPATVFASDRAVDEGPSGGHGFFLDLEDSKRDGDGTGSPVHWEYRPGAGTRGVLVYWLFYAYNDFTNDHEGDWERVAVQVDGDQPTGVTFWKHEQPACVIPWASMEKSEGHPVTYAAKGSHGSYPQVGGFRTALGTDRTSQGDRWRTWRQARAVTQQQWWRYRGVWGVTGPRWFSGIPGPFPDRDLAAALTTLPCAPDGGSAAMPTATPTPTPTPSPSSAPPATSTEAAVQRLERFLHAVGREDIRTVCEIAGPAAKQAEDQGFGPCESTFRITFAMFSAAQKAALRTATVRPELVVRRGPREIYVPTRAVRASVTFTERDIGDFVLSYLGDDWFIID